MKKYSNAMILSLIAIGFTTNTAGVVRSAFVGEPMEMWLYGYFLAWLDLGIYIYTDFRERW